MTKLVVQGATLACSMGSSPSKLSVAPTNETYGGSSPAATVQDMKPVTNLAPFGMCKSPITAQVSAATSAAAGVLSPAAMRARGSGAMGAGLEGASPSRAVAPRCCRTLANASASGAEPSRSRRGADGHRGRLSMVLAECARMFEMRARDVLRLMVGSVILVMVLVALVIAASRLAQPPLR